MANDAQRAHWNSDEAAHWVTHQNRYDAMLQALGDRVIDGASIDASARVLDVGCGCGATTLAAGALAASAAGIDLSEPMLSVARELAAGRDMAHLSFVQGDAQTHAFGAGSYDVVISRFGVMFFDNPVAAFSNIATALTPGGRLVFVCWQELARNEWILVPGAALAQHVALPPVGQPGQPGMFSLADPERIRSILEAAGFIEVGVEPVEEPILLGGGGSLDDAVGFLRGGGMGQAALAGASPDQQARAVDAVRESLAPYMSDGGVRIGAACWLVTARRS